MSIDKLLELDSENVGITKKNLAIFSPELPDALDDAARLFETFAHAFSQAGKDDEDISVLNDCFQKLKANTKNEMDAILKSPPPTGDSEKARTVLAAKAAYNRMWSRRIRGILLVYAHRCYEYAVTDLLRLRISSALGYLRNQIEAVAQISIMRENPEVAYEWLNVANNENGLRYYNKYKQKIFEFRDKHNLNFAWNLASGTSQHVRLASLVSSLSLSSFEERGRHVTEVKVSFQEVRPDEPEGLFLKALTILRTQERLFSVMAADDCLPESCDPILVDVRIPRFRQKGDRLWSRGEQVFPNQVAKWRKHNNAQAEENP